MLKRYCQITFTDAQISAMTDGTDPDGIRKLHDIIAFSTNEAMKTYYKNSPEAYTSLMAWLAKYPVADRVFRIIFPFPRMLINSTIAALDYSPVGLGKGIYNLLAGNPTKSGLFTGIEVSRQISKGAVGSFGMALGIILGALGVIRIDDEEDYLGPQLYLGDIRINLSELSPATIPFMTGAMITVPGAIGFGDRLSATGSLFLESIFIGDLMSMFGRDKKGLDIATYPVQQFANQLIPSIFKHLAKLIDPSRKRH